jgi:hypothetical protein
VLRIGRHFQFEAPDGWQESREGSRWVYRSSEGQELIIASSHVDGAGSLMDHERAKQELLSNALAAAAEGATQEGLVNTIPIKRDEAVTELPCWSFSSETPGKDAVFVGAVFGSDDGVLFATLEGPYSPEPLDIFHRFLRSVRRPVN